MSGALSARDAAHVNAALHLPEQPAYDWTGVLEDDAACPTTSYGPQALPCRRQADHDGGHAWIGSDVPDRHSDDTEDPR